MDYLLSFFVPKKMARFVTMSAIVAVAIFALCAYLLCLPIKINASSIDKMIKQNGYCSSDFINFETEYDYSSVKDLELKISNSQLEYADSDIHKVELVDEDNTINIIFDSNYTSFSNDLDLYELYGLEKKNGSITILFAKEFFYLERITSSANLEIIQGADYRYMDLDFSAFNNMHDLLSCIGNNLASLYGQVYSATFSISAILLVIILPILLTTVAYFLFRKRSAMKTFKEYFNIAAICSIAPTIIFFAIGFFASSFLNFYTTVFALYYLFAVYKINKI